MHWFFPGLLFFGPAFLFLGAMKVLFIFLVIALIVRLAGHGRRRDEYYRRWHGPEFAYQDAQVDPRRIAAMRFAAGKIDRAEFERIMTALDATAPAPPAA